MVGRRRAALGARRHGGPRRCARHRRRSCGCRGPRPPPGTSAIAAAAVPRLRPKTAPVPRQVVSRRPAPRKPAPAPDGAWPLFASPRPRVARHREALGMLYPCGGRTVSPLMVLILQQKRGFRNIRTARRRPHIPVAGASCYRSPISLGQPGFIGGGRVPRLS